MSDPRQKKFYKSSKFFIKKIAPSRQKKMFTISPTE